MNISKKCFDILCCTSEFELEKQISKLSESDAKQILKTMIQFFNEQRVNANNIIQFLQEKIYDIS